MRFFCWQNCWELLGIDLLPAEITALQVDTPQGLILKLCAVAVKSVLCINIVTHVLKNSKIQYTKNIFYLFLDQGDAGSVYKDRN